MKKLLILACMALSLSVMAQSVDQNDLNKIREGFVKDNYTKAMENALSSNPIKKNCLES